MEPQPIDLMTQEVTGHKVGFELVNNKSTAPPKSGATEDAEYSNRGMVGDVFFASVFVQSGV